MCWLCGLGQRFVVFVFIGRCFDRDLVCLWCWDVFRWRFLWLGCVDGVVYVFDVLCLEVFR